MTPPASGSSLLILVLATTMLGCATTPDSNAAASLERRHRAACERAGFAKQSDIESCIARGAGYQATNLPDRQCVAAVGKQVTQAMCY